MSLNTLLDGKIIKPWVLWLRRDNLPYRFTYEEGVENYLQGRPVHKSTDWKYIDLVIPTLKTRLRYFPKRGNHPFRWIERPDEATSLLLALSFSGK